MLALTGSFLSDLAALTTSETMRVLDALAKLDRDPRHPGLQTKKMNGCDFYEVRASQEIRIIAELAGDNVICNLVGHHDTTLRRALRLDSAALEYHESAFGEHQAINFSPERRARETDLALSHLTDDELRARFGVPGDWVAAVRASSSAEAILASGIDEVIGIQDAFRLAAEFEPDRVVRSKIRVIRGDILTYAVPEIERAEFVDQIALMAPHLRLSKVEIARFIEVLRTKRLRMILVTRDPQDMNHADAIKRLAEIPTNEILINENIYVQLVACLAPTPWGFGAIGSGGGHSVGGNELGIFVPSQIGEERTISQLASIVIDDLRTSLDTRRIQADSQ